MIATTSRDACELSFENLMRDHYSRAYAFAYRLADSREDAEDLTQEAFLRAYRAKHRYDPEKPFDRWLFRIIVNLFIDTLRARPQQPVYSLDRPLEGADGNVIFNEIPDEAADPARQVMRKVMDEQLQKAMGRLPGVFRETMQLTDIEGMSYEEAAQLLGCAVGTIRSRLHRARVMLRKAMQTRKLLEADSPAGLDQRNQGTGPGRSVNSPRAGSATRHQRPAVSLSTAV